MFVKKVVFSIAVFLLFVWGNNASLFTDRSAHQVQLLAHRGLAQTFDLEGVTGTTNTAEIIHDPEHPYLENTIESMKAAFDYGADIVEFDVRRTKDNQLAVFHDHDLSFRTDIEGEVSDYTMDELWAVDIGYGYTADGGSTYPFRGKYRGKMPEISEVLDTFSDKELLIDIKDGDIESAQILETHFENMTENQRSRISIYGGKEAVEYLHQKFPQMKHLYRKKLERGLIRYILLGWTGYVPSDLHNLHIHIPATYTRLMWGWPDKFLNRMERVGARVVVVAGDGKWSDGIDSKQDLEAVPDSFTGVIWTERVDVIASLLKGNHVAE